MVQLSLILLLAMLSAPVGMHLAMSQIYLQPWFEGEFRSQLVADYSSELERPVFSPLEPEILEEMAAESLPVWVASGPFVVEDGAILFIEQESTSAPPSPTSLPGGVHTATVTIPPMATVGAELTMPALATLPTTATTPSRPLPQTATPAPGLTPSPTATPIHDPSPTRTPSPTAVLTPTPSAVPSQTPLPTFTPRPTDKPTPTVPATVTPLPTATPLPPTPTPPPPTATPLPPPATYTPPPPPTNTPAPTATATPILPLNPVQPILECVIRHDDKHFTAYFGYDNPNLVAIILDLGHANRFVPPPDNRGQVTLFGPGRNWHAFSVTATTPILWQLNGRGVNAKWDDEPC